MERLTRWNEATEGAELTEYSEYEWKDLMSSLDVVDWCNLITAVNRLAEYEDTGYTPEEVKNLQARLKYQEALADAWESNAQSGLNLVHKYRELLTGAREVLKGYKDAEEQGLLIKANNGDCDNCKCLADLGDCVIFGYSKDTQEKCKQACSSLKGSGAE
jgi:hypothetical protein